MKIIINDELLKHLLNESGRRFSRCEAFGHLLSMIKGADNEKFQTSYNRIAKVWKWDNHLVRAFIDDLVNLNVISENRGMTSTVLTFTDEFKTQYKQLISLFSLLAIKTKKLEVSEALFYVVKKMTESDADTPLQISCRSLAKQFGWSHHTVPSFLNILERNGIISRCPSADGNTFEPGWAINFN